MGEERPCSEKSNSLNLVWCCQKLPYVTTTLPRLGQVSSPGTPWGDSTWPARDSQGWWAGTPRHWVWPFRAFNPSMCGTSTWTSGAPTSTMGGACKRRPTPLVLLQLYYWGLSVELIYLEPECTVQQLSVNYMSLSIYCFEHDLNLKHMNLLLVKTSSVTFSCHQ